MMNNYGTPPILLTCGKGSRVWDEGGDEYVDLIAGIAVNALGHGDPRITEAITDQLNNLGHVSNLHATEPGIELAERLISLTRRSSARVFFCDSGAEANETAFKMTRLTGRTKIVVAEGSFHGRTMGSLAITAQSGKADPFRPLPGDVVTVSYGDAAALEAAVDHAGSLLGTSSFPTSPLRLRRLERWLARHGEVATVIVEGTGTYGLGLTRVLKGAGHVVVEVNRPNRQLRRSRGKSDTVDAEAAVRAALAGHATAIPKSHDGIAERLRVLRVAYRSAKEQMTRIGGQLA